MSDATINAYAAADISLKNAVKEKKAGFVMIVCPAFSFVKVGQVNH
jgi:hypothetical protein